MSLFTKNKEDQLMTAIRQDIIKGTCLKHAQKEGGKQFEETLFLVTQEPQMLAQLHQIRTKKTSHSCATLIDFSENKCLHLFRNEADPIAYKEEVLSAAEKEQHFATYTELKALPYLSVNLAYGL